MLIGCDGANSIVADFLGLKPRKAFTSCAARAFTNYPNGHGFPPELFRVNKDGILLGRVPVDDRVMFWFALHQHYPEGTNLKMHVIIVEKFILLPRIF